MKEIQSGITVITAATIVKVAGSAVTFETVVGIGVGLIVIGLIKFLTEQ